MFLAYSLDKMRWSFMYCTATRRLKSLSCRYVSPHVCMYVYDESLMQNI